MGEWELTVVFEMLVVRGHSARTQAATGNLLELDLAREKRWGGGGQVSSLGSDQVKGACSVVKHCE